eukprot:TRINITY_DN15730_c0_g2_i1.p1 TRINITY_DN15730_c0_g2~~TRINITY_DN15730_c0_g2_i1.p1  ORF type:complete len:522 (+),score=51.16 TRINITY_DN15730_c0_g2_i1:91-1656(+)
MKVSSAAVATTVISSFLFGYLICVLNTSLSLIAVEFRWCNNDWQSECLASRLSQGMVNAAVYLGASVGAFLVGRRVIAALGSRRQICLADICFLAGAVLCACALDVKTLILGRILSGLGLGISAVAGPVYMAEITPRESRGAYASMHGVFIAVGILASIVFGYPQSPPPAGPQDGPMQGLDTWFWRLLVAIPAPLALLQSILFFFVLPVDPPSYLIEKNRVADARAVLYKIYDVPVPDGVADLGNTPSACLELQLEEMLESSMEAKTSPQMSVFTAMCDSWVRYAMFLGFAIAALQQACGINALMSYSNALFQDAGIPPAYLTTASIAMAWANLTVATISSKIVDCLGRRKLFLLGCGTQALAMGLLFLCLQGGRNIILGIMAVFCFSLFTTSFCVGLGNVTWLYLAEIYPVEIRSGALSACGVINWLSCFLVVFSARLMSLQQACQLFGTISAAGFVLVYVWVLETKGCSLFDNPVSPRSLRSSSSFLTTPKDPLTAMLLQDEDSENTSCGSRQVYMTVS